MFTPVHLFLCFVTFLLCENALSSSVLKTHSLNGEKLELLPLMGQMTNDTARAFIENKNVQLTSFLPASDVAIKRNIDHDSIWFYVQIEKISEDKVNYDLAFQYPHFEQIDLYIFKKTPANQTSQYSLIDEAHTSVLEPFANRRVMDPRYIFPLELQNESTYLILMRIAPLATGPSIAIVNRLTFREHSAIYFTIKGLIFGILFVMICYNFFLFCILRDRVYGWYVLYMLAALTYIVSISGFGYFLIWPDFPIFNRTILALSAPLSYLCASIFIIYFLELGKKNRYFLNFLKGSVVIWLLYCLLGVSGLRIGVVYLSQSILFLVFNLLVFGFAINQLIGGNPNAKYFVISWSLLIGLTTLYGAALLGFIPFNDNYAHFVHFGVCVEAALFSFAIGERIKQEQNDRVNAQATLIEVQKQHAESLEKQVAERTMDLADKNKKILKQSENIENILAEKNTIFANISHELRTPLSLIAGPVSKLSEAESELWKQHQLRLIRDNSQRMLRLVQQLFSLSRSHASNHEAKQIQHVSKICHWIIENMISLAQDKQQRLTTKIEDKLWTNALPDSIEKILLNLMSNAIKYSCANSEINLQVFSQKNVIKIYVSNEGKAIPKHKRPDLFNQFARLEANENTPGSGIGLAVVKELTLANNGEVRVLDNAKEGFATTFEVTLPRAENKHEEERGISANSQEFLSLEKSVAHSNNLDTNHLDTHNLDKNSPDVNSLKDDYTENLTNESIQILIVDDNRDITEFTASILHSEYHCITFSSALRAYNYAIDNVPDIVITDFMMPEMNGIELTNKLKNTLATRHIPVIMLTARDDPEIRRQRLHEFVDEFLSKPFEIEELKLLIRNRINSMKHVSDFVLRNSTADETNANTPENSRDNAFIEQLREIVERNFSNEALDLSFLSNELCLSPRPLQRKIKSLLGCSPMAYVKKIRVTKAKILLLDTDKSITEIAEAAGFGSANYFSRIFKEETTQTPRQFRLDKNNLNSKSR